MREDRKITTTGDKEEAKGGKRMYQKKAKGDSKADKEETQMRQ